MKVFGIRTCDTVKKARKWLDDAGINYEFHDFKKHGLTSEKLSQWERAVGWETLLNRRGTTWRKLPDEVRDSIDSQSAHQIMLENTSIIKRPVVERGDSLSVGFSEDEWTVWKN